MVQFLGTIRPSSLSYFATYKRQLSLHSPPITAPANGFSPFRRIFNSYLQSYSATTGAGSPCEQSEIIFIGTGTSEGIPRVSCLTNPLKTCAVCLIAVVGSSLSINEGFSTTVLSNGLLPTGLDDLRDWINNVQPTIPIYVPQRDFEVMKKTHYYLVDTSVVLAGAAVSELQFNIIHEDPFVVQDLK
ncbi:hypothetical protein C1H46_030623 [Malus baccata]|uniref:Uncharacterized protein n=1 Tax=Malus baccata TaxID=106549 RepID=A0A540LC14_MALBA|nr:hypothetical protein C1H46_030623 [Malus baccata]